MAAYGYGPVVHEILTSGVALINADSYAIFGLISRLADFHYRLDSDPARADAGKLQYDVHLSPPNAIVNALPFNRRRRKRANSSSQTKTPAGIDTLVNNKV